MGFLNFLLWRQILTQSSMARQRKPYYRKKMKCRRGAGCGLDGD